MDINVIKWVSTLNEWINLAIFKNLKALGYVWFPENTKERKKMQRKMIFSCLVVLWKI